MDRRDFLSPGQFAAGAGQFLAAADELRAAALEAPAPPQEFALLRFSRRAMATTFEVMLPFGTPDALAAADAALDEIDRLEAQLTVYRDTSEVSRLNRAAPFAAIPVEEGLFDLLCLAARVTAATDGAFDVTAGALIKAWGFFRGPRHVPSAEERAAALGRVGMRHVLLEPETRSVRYRRQGLEINLGSIGKGYALDRAAAVMRRHWNFPGALLHGGHSSVYAIGNEPGDERGWAVGLGHPWDPGRRIALLRLRDRALGTSAATFRHLEHEGRKLGHVLDPRSGWPAEGVALASAVASSAAEADALATAFYVLGVDPTRDYCDTHPEIGAVLLPEGESVPVVLGIARQLIEAV
ncbi:MAG TPA: FAD:protein FMN transferase [Gemmataceae bacterium]|nr:FAD:protein FMN transferase [Gemmataceae bacterium]